MHHSSDTTRAALLLTNRLVSLDAKPMTAREFWALVQRIDPGDLIRHDEATIAQLAEVDDDEAARIRILLDAATALSFEEERLRDGGVLLISALDEQFPATLRERLGTACPAFLLVAGPVESLSRPSLSIVGSPDAGDEALAIAQRSAQLAVERGWPVVGGLAGGVDHVAMVGALDAGGVAVGVPAEGILKASRNAEVRHRVHEGRLSIASPFAPNAPFRSGNATGRDKIVSALSRVTFVVASGDGQAGAAAGAEDALDRGDASVAVWAGSGANDGNEALIRRGATPITDLDQLFDIEATIPPRQDSLF